MEYLPAILVVPVDDPAEAEEYEIKVYFRAKDFKYFYIDTEMDEIVYFICEAEFSAPNTKETFNKCNKLLDKHSYDFKIN